MTSEKQMAKELIEQFLKADFNCKGCVIPYCDIACVKLGFKEAKACALICVDRMVKVLEEYDKRTEEYIKNDYLSFELQNMDGDFRFLSKVKQEIQAYESISDLR